MEDTLKHQALRKKLVDIVKGKGIKNIAVLQAIGSVPRHLFIDSAFEKGFAYEDKAFEIGEGQTISQPYTVAYQSELLEVRKGDTVLEIGTGSGYQSAVLSALGAKVFSIERHKKLNEKAQALLKELGCTVKCFYGDGYKGLPAFAPFDRVIVTAAAPYVPDALLEQLKPNGILIIPVGESEVQLMKKIKKLPNGGFTTTEYGKFSFVPMLKATDWDSPTA